LLRKDQPQLQARPHPFARVTMAAGLLQVRLCRIEQTGQQIRLGARSKRPIVGRRHDFRVGENLAGKPRRLVARPAEKRHARPVYLRVVGALFLVEAPVPFGRFKKGRAPCRAAKLDGRVFGKPRLEGEEVRLLRTVELPFLEKPLRPFRCPGIGQRQQALMLQRLAVGEAIEMLAGLVESLQQIALVQRLLHIGDACFQALAHRPLLLSLRGD
jgi:hypothetical protein